MRFLATNIAIFFMVLARPAFSDTPAIILPLVRLIVHPELFVGARVQVIGYLEDTVNLEIFLTKDHAIMRDYASSILVNDTDTGEITFSECTSKYVEITGDFERTEDNNFIITNVTKIQTEEYKICWKR